MAKTFDPYETLADMTELLPDLPAPTINERFDVLLLPEQIQRDDPPDDRFLATVLKWGVLDALWIHYHTATKTYTVIDGRERQWASRLVMITKPERRYVPAKIWTDITPAQESALTALGNRLRSENPITDVIAVRRLHALHFTPDQIRAAAGLHPATLKSFGKYDNLLPELEEAWIMYGTLDTPTIDQIVRCTEEEQGLLLRIYKEQGNVLRKANVEMVLAQRPKEAVTVKVNARASWQEQVRALLVQAFNLVPDTDAFANIRRHLTQIVGSMDAALAAQAELLKQ